MDLPRRLCGPLRHMQAQLSSCDRKGKLHIDTASMKASWRWNVPCSSKTELPVIATLLGCQHQHQHQHQHVMQIAKGWMRSRTGGSPRKQSATCRDDECEMRCTPCLPGCSAAVLDNELNCSVSTNVRGVETDRSKQK